MYCKRGNEEEVNKLINYFKKLVDVYHADMYAGNNQHVSAATQILNIFGPGDAKYNDMQSFIQDHPMEIRIIGALNDSKNNSSNADDYY